MCLNSLWQIMNSNFTTSLLGSGAGALAGAWIAQRLMERQKSREELLTEIRAVNSAITAAFTICNRVIGLKKQHLIEMKNKYNNDRENFSRSIGQQARGGREFTLDLRALPQLVLPVDILKGTVANKVSADRRPLALIISIVETDLLLNQSIVFRNQLIEKFKSLLSNGDQHLGCIYFGISYEINSGGMHQAEYKDTLENICIHADDLIFYSHLLCGDLEKHGAELRNKFQQQKGKNTPTIVSVSFDEANEQGLLPDNEKYKDWLTSFVESNPLLRN